MDVILKPLKGDNFHVKVEVTDKICDVKKKIEELKPDFPADALKLIYNGKILSDESTIQDSGYLSTGFIVVMVAKAKPAAAPRTEAAPAVAPASPVPAPAPDADAQAAARLVSGSGVEATIQQLCDMGFARPEVERCLAAAFNNPDRAVEYLMNGIPDDAAPASIAPQGGSTPFPAIPPAGAGAVSGGPLPPGLAELRNHPQFAQLAAVVAQNPALLGQILPAIEQTNPEIVQAIQQNPEAFMQLLQEAGAGGGGGLFVPPAGDARLGQMQQLAGLLQQNPQMLEQMLPELLPEIEQNDPEAARAIRENPQVLLQMIQAAAAAGGGAGGGLGGAPQATIQLSAEDSAAVERLAALGFDKQMAAQAYLLCDKNEELAANFLFDNAEG